MADKKIRNIYDLKYEHLRKNPHSHFFDRETLEFFGERLSSMRLLQGTVEKPDSLGVMHTCYVVSSTQKVPMVGRKRVYHYFDTGTLEDI